MSELTDEFFDERKKTQRMVAEAKEVIPYLGRIKSASDRLLLLVFVNHYNLKTEQCDPSHERLALLTGMSESEVNRGKKTLREAGYLAWETRGFGKHKYCDYTINFDTIAGDGQEHRDQVTEEMGSGTV